MTCLVGVNLAPEIDCFINKAKEQEADVSVSELQCRDCSPRVSVYECVHEMTCHSVIMCVGGKGEIKYC